MMIYVYINIIYYIIRASLYITFIENKLRFQYMV